MDRLYYNIIVTVGTTEVDLAPYPGGTATVPSDRYRKLYALVLTNTAAAANTLTIRIYKGATIEREVAITVDAGKTLSIIGTDESPILIVPPDRTLKAVASATTIIALVAGYDG